MPENSADSRIKAPMSLRTLIGILLPGLLLALTPITNADRYPYIYYLRVFWLSASLLAFLFILFNALRKAGRLKWGTDALVVRNRSYSGKEIKAIYIDGPLVGILPEGKRIVPVNLCFRFIEDREQDMKRLMNWTEANGIKLKYKRFVKWM
ncbi:hypothetical protein QW71_10640 [Paenibacillus sp. IHB B 3415]|uniref:hypothetical protein n=1 Tax=Paenibacillus sp. IHB B 3415 TaxID=867080 RepID=UPI000574C780|nr:hypothetical protein [Paenibacillus sp. IHB B 3415]KHL95800.1 hypothetical protein QW71_10640 [Paenibacillus sp. IHB B 3415]